MERARELTEELTLALREEIRARGLTLTEVGARLGKPRLYVSQMLRGNLDLKWVHVSDVLGILEVEPSRFLAHLHPPKEPPQIASVRQALLKVVLALGVEPPSELSTASLERLMDRLPPTAVAAEDDAAFSNAPAERSAERSRQLAQALLRRLRSLGLTQREVAHQVQLTEIYLGATLRGETSLKVKQFYACCLAMEAEPGEVLREVWPLPFDREPALHLDRLVQLTISTLRGEGLSSLP